MPALGQWDLFSILKEEVLAKAGYLWSEVVPCLRMLPEMKTTIPGPCSLELARELRKYESHNVTYVSEDWPIFWDRAEGSLVWDVDGNRFFDMTSAFGVAGVGHTHPAVADAMRKQADKLMHAMGDVHPTQLKVEVCRLLSDLTYERWGYGVGKTLLANSGFEAVEGALKTAYVATNKAGVVCFGGGYHGLGYGALLVNGFKKFRNPFSNQLADIRVELDYPRTAKDMLMLEEQLRSIDVSKVGALLVEPIQGRGGKVVPPEGFLLALRSWCDANHVCLIFDEIYSGFHRTGELWACDWEKVVPDIICLGKALSGGYPISACVGKADVMDCWPESSGEALHTSTFLGNPVGCAMAVEAMKLHADFSLGEKVKKQGDRLRFLLDGLESPLIHEVRGKGLMLGVELRHIDGRPAGDVAGPMLAQLLSRGIIMLADGEYGNVLAFTPPFDMTEEQMELVVKTVQELLVSSSL